MLLQIDFLQGAKLLQRYQNDKKNNLGQFDMDWKILTCNKAIIGCKKYKSKMTYGLIWYNDRVVKISTFYLIVIGIVIPSLKSIGQF